MNLWQVPAIIGAGLTAGRSYMQSSADRERATRFLHNRLALAIGAVIFTVLAGLAVADAEAAGMISALSIAALVAASVDEVKHRRSHAYVGLR